MSPLGNETWKLHRQDISGQAEIASRRDEIGVPAYAECKYRIVASRDHGNLGFSLQEPSKEEQLLLYIALQKEHVSFHGFGIFLNLSLENEGEDKGGCYCHRNES